MKILKNDGNFEILTPVRELRAQLKRIEKAGRTCYQSKKKISKETAKEFIRKRLRDGHESVIEHSNMTVQFNNISRGFTHEQVRHRLTAISQESTRYVDYYAKKGEGANLEKFQLKCIVPPHQNENKKVKLEDGRKMSAIEMFAEYEKFYRALRRAGWLPEDARQFLPIGIKSQIVISANFREWRHIFKMRTFKYAHWEIRTVMCNLLEFIQPILSPVFDDFKEAGIDKNNIHYFEKIKRYFKKIDQS